MGTGFEKTTEELIEGYFKKAEGKKYLNRIGIKL